MAIHKTIQYRRHQNWKAKEKAKRILKSDIAWPYPPTSKEIGKKASVHSKGCSCECCGNPRRHFGNRSVQERRYALQDPQRQA